MCCINCEGGALHLPTQWRPVHARHKILKNRPNSSSIFQIFHVRGTDCKVIMESHPFCQSINVIIYYCVEEITGNLLRRNGHGGSRYNDLEGKILLL